MTNTTNNDNQPEVPAPGFDFDADLQPYIAHARPGVPKPTGEPKVTVPVRIAPELLDAIRALATQRGIGHTTLMAHWIETAATEALDPHQGMIPVDEIRRLLAEITRKAHSAA